MSRLSQIDAIDPIKPSVVRNDSPLAFDPKNGTIIWTSPHLYGRTPINNLKFVDTDGDGQSELAFGAARAMYLTR